MIDVIKAAFQIGIQDILGLVINDYPDSCDGILTGASWAEAIAVWLEFGFPGWFESELHEGLMRSCFHHGDTKRALFALAWFRDIDPSYRLGFHLLPVLWVKVFSHCKTLRRFDSFYSIDPCGFLALIVLGHSTHCEQSRCPGRASTVFEVFELLVGCHVARLERCAFVSCTHVAQTCARATCANSHSQDQGGISPWSWVPSSL